MKYRVFILSAGLFVTPSALSDGFDSESQALKACKALGLDEVTILPFQNPQAIEKQALTVEKSVKPSQTASSPKVEPKATA